MNQFPWLKNYPEGVPYTVSNYKHSSIIEWFDDVCSQHSNRVAFENFGEQVSFKKLHAYASCFASYLQNELGLQKNDRIAIQIPNLLQFPIALFGALKAGLIVVNTNPLYTAHEMKHQFCDADISAVVILDNFAYNLESIKKDIPAKHIIITRMGDMIGGVKGHIINFMVKYIKKLVPKFHLPNAISFKHALRNGAPEQYKAPETDIEETIMLQYTGGTTGVSKGAQLSHRNLIAHNEIITHWFKPYLDQGGTNIVITAIPMYHIFALTVNGFMMFGQGIKNVLITNPRDMHGFVKELRRHKFTLMTGVNTLFKGLMDTPGFESLDFSSLHGTVGGGMAVHDIVAQQWEKTTGTPMVGGYGLSETSPVLCCNPLDGNHKIGTVGLPVPSTEVAIFSDDGKQLATGQTGEICARGPQVMSGYWKKDNTGVFFPGGWFKTGDIGFMDKDNFLKIIDRKKDMIIISGFNVYPNEVENIIADHPKVQDVAVIGVVNQESDEVVKAVIVKKDLSLTEEETIAFCKTRLTQYKIPKLVEFRNEIPKSNVGKVLRRILREDQETNQLSK